MLSASPSPPPSPKPKPPPSPKPSPPPSPKPSPPPTPPPAPGTPMCDNMGQFAAREPIEQCQLKDGTDGTTCNRYKEENDDGTVTPCQWRKVGRGGLRPPYECRPKTSMAGTLTYGCPPPTPPPSAP